MQKNVASQKWIVFAFDRTDNTAKTGDAANITANLRLDGGVANGVDDTNPTELEDGYYVFDITQAETNADMIVICPVSVTGNIQVIGVPGALYTTPSAFPALTKSAIINEFETQSQADPTGFHVNVKEVNGTGQTANDNGADINEILTDTGSTLDALIKDIPTVAEFEARTILAANYVVVGDTIAGVTAVTNDVGITQAGADKVRASVCVTGDPANSIGKALYEIYTNRLTSTRAGYLDELSAANLPTDIANIKSETADILADVTGIAGSAMRGTNNAALAATALSTATWTAAKSAFLDAAISSRSSHTIAQVKTQVDTALSDISLDHLIHSPLPTPLISDIDAQSAFGWLLNKDGDWTGWDRTTDSGEGNAEAAGGATAAQVWAYVTRTLTAGGDASALNQTTIINHLTDVKGTSFTKDTHSLTNILYAAKKIFIRAGKP